MQFPKFDFDQMQKILNNMSEEDKASLNSMAQDVLSQMNMPNSADEPIAAEEEENDESFYDKLNIKEEQYNDLPGIVLENLEAACDLEEFYEDYPDADLSGSALFYIKALLNALKETAYPVFKEADSLNRLPIKAALSLQDLIDFLSDMNEETLIDKGYGSQDYLDWLKGLLVSLNNFLSLAEYGVVKKTELSLIKSLLIENDALLTINSAASINA